jgi:hypothetical protein
MRKSTQTTAPKVESFEQRPSESLWRRVFRHPIVVHPVTGEQGRWHYSPFGGTESFYFVPAKNN